METMQVSLTSQMTESGAVARLQISIRKLVQKQLDSGDINTQLLRAAFDLQVWFHDTMVTLSILWTCDPTNGFEILAKDPVNSRKAIRRST